MISNHAEVLDKLFVYDLPDLVLIQTHYLIQQINDKRYKWTEDTKAAPYVSRNVTQFIHILDNVYAIRHPLVLSTDQCRESNDEHLNDIFDDFFDAMTLGMYTPPDSRHPGIISYNIFNYLSTDDAGKEFEPAIDMVKNLYHEFFHHLTCIVLKVTPGEYSEITHNQSKVWKDWYEKAEKYANDWSLRQANRIPAILVGR